MAFLLLREIRPPLQREKTVVRTCSTLAELEEERSIVIGQRHLVLPLECSYLGLGEPRTHAEAVCLDAKLMLMLLPTFLAEVIEFLPDPFQTVEEFCIVGVHRLAHVAIDA
jgi:hypothetical protein